MAQKLVSFSMPHSSDFATWNQWML